MYIASVNMCTEVFYEMLIDMPMYLCHELNLILFFLMLSQYIYATVIELIFVVLIIYVKITYCDKMVILKSH